MTTFLQDPALGMLSYDMSEVRFYLVTSVCGVGPRQVDFSETFE
jgi:hypothetical protein